MRPRPLLATTVLVTSLAVPAHAKMARIEYEPIPVSRLIENVNAYIKANPKDADGYYKLARIHSIAFAKSVQLSTPTVEVAKGTDQPVESQVVGPSQEAIAAVLPGSPTFYGDKKLPNFQDSDNEPRDVAKGAITPTDMEHIREALFNYAIATRLNPKDAYSWLGYGWMIEQGAPYASKLGQPWLAKDDPARDGLIYDGATTTQSWIRLARDAYNAAFALHSTEGIRFNKSPSIEAGRYLVEIFKQKKILSDIEQEQIEQIEAEIKKYDEAPRAVSPIILPLGRSTSLPSLLGKNLSSTFDLANEGLNRRWPWVGADTGILVWDPENTGRITSGRQLFGSVTWWINWKNGYEVLDALDNNHDGQLTGEELKGIAIWRDANGNGVTNPGEVKPLADWGIASLATKATKKIGGFPSNLRGVTKVDGTVLPTYDWTPHSLN